MTAHEKSSDESRELCDLLFSSVNDELQNKLQVVTRNEGKNWCNCGITTRFAYIYHRRNGIRVYLYLKESHESDLNTLTGNRPTIKLQHRSKKKSSWEQSTYFFLDIDSEEETRAATPLLLYAANKVKVRPNSYFLQPSEENASELLEGKRFTVQVSRAERSTEARGKCIEIFGPCCSVCGFDFERTYGEIGSGFIHVHHLNLIAGAKGQRQVDPRTDLRPVCPNCHEMLHKKTPPLSIEELVARISKIKG